MLSFPELNKSVMMAEKEAESLRTALQSNVLSDMFPLRRQVVGCCWGNLPGVWPRILLQELAALAGLCVCFVTGMRV